MPSRCLQVYFGIASADDVSLVIRTRCTIQFYVKLVKIVIKLALIHYDYSLSRDVTTVLCLETKKKCLY
jgi:hypothetical protein